MTTLSQAKSDLSRAVQDLAQREGWALPEWWSNTACPGTTPASPEERLQRAEAIGRLHEGQLAAEERRQRGAHLTPGRIALALAQSIYDESPEQHSVVDPCCGAGIFLVAARTLWGRALNLYGNDMSASALSATWASFAVAFPDSPEAPRLSLTCGDGLLIDIPQCSMVLTNPPFRSAMRQTSGSDKANFKRYRERWTLGARGRSDLSSTFLEACARSLKPGGVLGILLPEAQLATESGLPLRVWLAQAGTPKSVVHLGADAFPDASVRTCILTWVADVQAGARFRSQSGDHSSTTMATALRSGAWASYFYNPHCPPPHQSQKPTEPLGALAQVRRLFTDDFYFVGRSMTEANDAPEHPVLTVAHVDPGHHRWGQRAVRVAGARWLRPCIDTQRMRAEDPARTEDLLNRWARPRIALATRGAVIEACRIPAGTVAQVPLIELWCDDPDEEALIYAQLLAPATTAWYLQHHASKDQTGAGIDLRGAALKALPIVPKRHWPEALKTRVLEQIQDLEDYTPERLLRLQHSVAELFPEAPDAAIAWWWSRVPRHMERPPR